MIAKSLLAKPFAKYTYNKTTSWKNNPVETQNKVFKELIASAKDTVYGRDHHFSNIHDYDTFKNNVPINDYEDLKPYIEKVRKGEKNVLWHGLPLYLAKTSGTTSGAKYIPITKSSISGHFKSALNALMNYTHITGKKKWLNKKHLFLSGSPKLENINNIHIGRLSGLINHHIPYIFRTNQIPDFKTNCIEDWETKLDKIVDITLKKDVSLISGIPPWMQMYFNRIMDKTGKTIKEVFPNFEVLVHGGVNFSPYAKQIYNSIGEYVDTIETYPASEGFIAYQDCGFDTLENTELLLLLNNGMFFEFVEADEYHKANPSRYSIADVQLGVNYALIISSNAGLWGYSIGDTIKFVSKDPYRIVFTGRIKHFVSAFGEHVIAEEVETALKLTMKQFPESAVNEYTVAPFVSPKEGLPRHEWYISFATKPNNLASFTKTLNLHLQKLNPYYDDLLRGNVLEELKIIELKKTAFIDYMKSVGKLGGQNKLPRLTNNRDIATALMKYK